MLRETGSKPLSRVVAMTTTVVARSRDSYTLVELQHRSLRTSCQSKYFQLSEMSVEIVWNAR